MNLAEKFQHFIKKENLFQQKDRLLLAVSGGVDSVVLCELCRRCEFDFIIAHCNFNLRGIESDEDENFVKGLGIKYGVEVFVEKFDTLNYAGKNKISIQVAARNLRYSWFSELLAKQHHNIVNHLLTAHQANDNIETLMMNFFRGTGMTGLLGILPKQKYEAYYMIRPLLFVKKEEIIDFANKNNLQYREDSSNAENKYTRNFFRNEVIPALQQVYPQVEENLLQNISRFKDINIFYNQALLDTKEKLIFKRGNEYHIPVLKLAKTNGLHTMIYDITKEFGFSALQSEEVLKLLKAESGKYICSATHRILRNRAWLIISPLHNTEVQQYLVEENEGELIFKGGKIKVEKITDPVDINPDPDIALLNAAEIQFPLIVRKWKQGDYFYPLGMQKKKKLSRFFSDQKLSLLQKENTWVIESNKKIIWIIGQRIDNRFKLKPTVTNVLRLSLFHAAP